MLKQKYGLGFVILLIGLILVVTGCQVLGAGYEFKGNVFDPPAPLPDFELMDTSGQPFHLSDLEGDIALIYFGYTFCPDVCPLTMVDVRDALSGLETGQERVQVVFISVDPERDTPGVLSGYLAAFDSNYIGLTDDYEKIQEIMTPYGAFAQKEEVTDSAAGYLVSHTSRVYLVSPERELLLTYPFGFEAEDLRSDLTHLLRQEANSS